MAGFSKTNPIKKTDRYKKTITLELRKEPINYNLERETTVTLSPKDAIEIRLAFICKMLVQQQEITKTEEMINEKKAEIKALEKVKKRLKNNYEGKKLEFERILSIFIAGEKK